MLSKKRVVFAILGIIILAGAVGSGYYIYSKKHKKTVVTNVNKTETPPVVNFNNFKNGNQQNSKDTVANVDVVNNGQKLASKDYSGVIASAKIIYENKNIMVGTRVQAAAQCITAAIAIKDTATVNLCKDAGNKIIADATNISTDERNYYTFLIKYALGEAKQSDFAGSNAGL